MLDDRGHFMRDKKFTFVIDELEKELLTSLATCLQRTRGDVLRMLIREAAGEGKITTQLPKSALTRILSKEVKDKNSI
jgi:hypothetical protein